MAGVVLITNPRSHWVSRNGSRLKAIAAALPEAVLLIAEDVSDLTGAISAEIEKGQNVFLIEGGDGTVQAVLTTCVTHRQFDPAVFLFGILPGGSTNLAYRLFGINRIDRTALEARVRALINNGQNTAIHTQRALRLSSPEQGRTLVGFLLSTGSLARTMLFTQRHMHSARRRGVLSVIKTIAQLAARPRSTRDEDGEPIIRPSEFTVENTGGVTSRRAFTVFSTLDRLSLEINPFWNRGEHPIAQTYSEWPIRSLRIGILKLVTGLAGQRLEKHGLASAGLSELRFRCDGPMVLDGEQVSGPPRDTFHLKATPELRFLR